MTSSALAPRARPSVPYGHAMRRAERVEVGRRRTTHAAPPRVPLTAPRLRHRAWYGACHWGASCPSIDGPVSQLRPPDRLRSNAASQGRLKLGSLCLIARLCRDRDTNACLLRGVARRSATSQARLRARATSAEWLGEGPGEHRRTSYTGLLQRASSHCVAAAGHTRPGALHGREVKGPGVGGGRACQGEGAWFGTVPWAATPCLWDTIASSVRGGSTRWARGELLCAALLEQRTCGGAPKRVHMWRSLCGAGGEAGGEARWR